MDVCMSRAMDFYPLQKIWVKNQAVSMVERFLTTQTNQQQMH